MIPWKKAALYANAVQKKTGAMEHCVEFINGTVMAVARHDNNEAQTVAYRGHEKKQTMHFSL